MASRQPAVRSAGVSPILSVPDVRRSAVLNKAGPPRATAHHVGAAGSSRVPKRGIATPGFTLALIQTSVVVKGSEPRMPERIRKFVAISDHQPGKTWEHGLQCELVKYSSARVCKRSPRRKGPNAAGQKTQNERGSVVEERCFPRSRDSSTWSFHQS